MTRHLPHVLHPLYRSSHETASGWTTSPSEMNINIIISIFWDITPCSPLKVNRRFEGTYRFFLQDRRTSQARNQPVANRPVFLSVYMYTNTVFSAALYAVPGLTTPFPVLFLLLHNMFLSRKDHRQVHMLLYVNCYAVGTLILRYVLHYFPTICLWLHSPGGPWPLFQFPNIYSR
jgi:hypothetical protein